MINIKEKCKIQLILQNSDEEKILVIWNVFINILTL